MGDRAREHWVWRRPWLAALLLYLPMVAVFAAHLWGSPAALWPTGFLQGDQPGYMATALQHLERGFTLFYPLPYSAEPASPAIYFQPFTLLLGVVQWASSADPGRLYLAAGALAGLVCLRLAIALYARFVDGRDGAAALGLLLFCWGGGLFVAATFVHRTLTGQPELDLFLFDPQGGLWFLNLGRNLFYSVEAFYHALVFALLLALLARRWRLAALLLALLSISHPFTGLQFLAIAAAWLAAERWLRRAAGPPRWLVLAAPLLLTLHLGCYLWLMPRLSAEHAALMAQWRLAWTLEPRQFLLAYGLVGALALCSLAGRDRRAAALADPGRRLLLVWFAVSLLLAKHELFMAPTQPLHFTRGYLWTPLFLLGAETLVDLLRRLPSRRLLRRGAAAALALLFLLDNAAWLLRAARQATGTTEAVAHLAADERALLAILAEPRLAEHLVIAPADGDNKLAYLAVVYTPLRAWRSHGFNTPWSEQRLAEIRAFHADGTEPAAWQGRPLLILVAGDAAAAREAPWFAAGDRLLFASPALSLVERPGAP